jgi:hypothetical protein
MAHLITFRSSRFDPSAEPANPINPIAGHAVLTWLVDVLRANGYDAGEPDAEDWGWYVNVTGHDASYLVGASGESESEGSTAIDWTLQIHRHRSFTDKLFGRNVHTADDRLSAIAERVVRAEPSFTNVSVDRAG